MPGRTNLSYHSLENDTLLDRLPYCFLHTTWFCQHKERKIFISCLSGHVMFYLFTFFAKGAIYYVAIATVIFSHVKIQSCTLFLGKSSPSISLVVI